MPANLSNPFPSKLYKNEPFVQKLPFGRDFFKGRGIFAGVLLENAVEMALIGKTSQVGDLGQRIIGRLYQFQGFFNPQLPDILPKG
jgi:hypothetical protein